MRAIIIAIIILLVCIWKGHCQEITLFSDVVQPSDTAAMLHSYIERKDTSRQKVVMTLENPCDCPARYSLREFVRTVDGYMIPSEHKLVFGVIDKESKKRITVLLEKTYPVVLVEVWNFYDDSDDWKEHQMFMKNDCIKYDTWYAQDGDGLKIECK